MQKWPFAGPDTHRTFDARDLADFLESAGFRRSHIIIANAELALGVKGLIAVAGKSGGSIGSGKQGRGQPTLQRRLDVSGSQTLDATSHGQTNSFAISS
jgi:hypothetical protein